MRQRVVDGQSIGQLRHFKMSIIDVIFFASFILFFLSVVGLVFGRLIARMMKPMWGPGPNRATEKRRTDETRRQWQFLGDESRQARD